MFKRIMFITGTRADFGKIKPLIEVLDRREHFEVSLFVTGMHTLSKYGYTADEVFKNIDDRRLAGGFRKIHTYMNQIYGEPMDMALANTIQGLSRYVHECSPDMIVVHGDRIETMAGAIVGAMRMIKVAHVEGGEVSGTIDELIRHAVTKLSHIHFVANEEARDRLIQLGEQVNSISVIGSPDIDVMLSDRLPPLDEVIRYYEIPFPNYSIVILHPVTTNNHETRSTAIQMMEAISKSEGNFLFIYPNNDEGCEHIFEAYEKVREDKRFAFYPSLRFESFLTLLKHAKCIIGNSSAGIREAPVYGVRTVNIASRQHKRFQHETIDDVAADSCSIQAAIQRAINLPRGKPTYHFGHGQSANLFVQTLERNEIWELSCQKHMVDLPGLRGPNQGN